MEENSLGRVLVVDDDPAVLSTISSILEGDYAVSAVTSGQEALALLKTVQVDLILLDLLMPEMDGLEVCAALKDNPDTAHIPVIFITVIDEPTSEELALDAGAVDYISKPLRPRVVKSRVGLQLEKGLYVQFLERMLRSKDLTIEKLRAESQELLDSIGLSKPR